MTAEPDLLESVAVQARSHPDRPAIRDRRGRVVTYGELWSGTRALARELRLAGVGPGDGVLLAVRPSPRAVTAALGTVLVGGVVIVADPGAGDALLEARRRLAPARAAVADTVVHAAATSVAVAVTSRIPALAGLRLPDLSDPALLQVVSGPWLPGVPRGARRWSGLRDDPAWEPPELPAARDALVVFTSGSTAQPRAVVHTLSSLSHGVAALRAALALDEKVVMHSDQLMIGLPVLAAGGRWSLPPATSSTDAWVRQCADSGATHAYAVPHKLLAAGEVGLPASVRWVGTGGAPVLPGAVRRLRELAPAVEVTGIYGMTEALPVAVATGEQIVASPPGCVVVGRPVDGVAVSVQDGQLVVAGPTVRDRYVGHEAGGAPVLTGDLGDVTPDGVVMLHGRAKRMLIRGQANIYPDLVETLLPQAFPELDDAALVGLPDPVSGDERILLAVVPAVVPAVGRSRSDVDQAVRARWQQVADAAWLPDEVVVVDRIPRRGRSAAVDVAALTALVCEATGEPCASR